MSVYQSILYIIQKNGQDKAEAFIWFTVLTLLCIDFQDTYKNVRTCDNVPGSLIFI